jgi:hypothetical protein
MKTRPKLLFFAEQATYLLEWHVGQDLDHRLESLMRFRPTCILLFGNGIDRVGSTHHTSRRQDKKRKERESNV